MFGDQSPLSIPLQSFWSPQANKQRQSEPTAESDTGFCETVWDELVRWFDQNREWAELVACLEPSGA